MHIISSSRAGARQWHFVSLTVPFQFCPVQPFSHIHKRAVLASIAHTYQQFSNPFRNRQCILSLPLLCILIGLNKTCYYSFFLQLFTQLLEKHCLSVQPLHLCLSHLPLVCWVFFRFIRCLFHLFIWPRVCLLVCLMIWMSFPLSVRDQDVWL